MRRRLVYVAGIPETRTDSDYWHLVGKVEIESVLHSNDDMYVPLSRNKKNYAFLWCILICFKRLSNL